MLGRYVFNNYLVNLKELTQHILHEMTHKKTVIICRTSSRRDIENETCFKNRKSLCIERNVIFLHSQNIA